MHCCSQVTLAFGVCVVNEFIESSSVSIDGTRTDLRWLQRLGNYDFVDSWSNEVKCFGSFASRLSHHLGRAYIAMQHIGTILQVSLWRQILEKVKWVGKRICRIYKLDFPLESKPWNLAWEIQCTTTAIKSLFQNDIFNGIFMYNKRKQTELLR